MPIQYKPDQWAWMPTTSELDIYPDGAEQEHKDSCDVNKMIKGALNGMTLKGSGIQPKYGYDDTTLDGLTHRIEKQKLEASLQNLAGTVEFSDEELKYVPESVQKKFKFRKKSPPKAAPDGAAPQTAQDAPTNGSKAVT